MSIEANELVEHGRILVERVEFDDEGHRRESIEYEGGQPKTKCCRHYNAEGALVRVDTYDAHGPLVERTTYSYQGGGVRTAITCNADGAVIRTVVRRATGSNASRDSHYGQDGQLWRVVEDSPDKYTEYDCEGRINYQVAWDRDPETAAVNETRFYRAGGQLEDFRRYERSGGECKWVHYGADGAEIGRGRETRECDSEGNWIRKIVTTFASMASGIIGSATVTYRRIEYFTRKV